MHLPAIALALSTVLLTVPVAGQTPPADPTAPWATPLPYTAGRTVGHTAPEVRRARRVLAELLGVAAGAAVGLGAGAGVGCGVNPSNCFQGLPYGMFAVGIFTLPAGVFAAGGLLRGNGGYGWTLLGEIAGLAVATPIAALVSNTIAVGVIVGVLPVIGMIASYELSSDDVAPATQHPDRAPTPPVVPSIALLPGGATVGLGGTF